MNENQAGRHCFHCRRKANRTWNPYLRPERTIISRVAEFEAPMMLANFPEQITAQASQATTVTTCEAKRDLGSQAASSAHLQTSSQTNVCVASETLPQLNMYGHTALECTLRDWWFRMACIDQRNGLTFWLSADGIALYRFLRQLARKAEWEKRILDNGFSLLGGNQRLRIIGPRSPDSDAKGCTASAAWGLMTQLSWASKKASLCGDHDGSFLSL